MANEVSIIITAVDKTTGALKSVGGAIGSLGKVALGVGAAGLAALGAGLTFAIKEAMEAEEVAAQLNAVLKATGGAAGITAEEASTLADSLTKVTRFSDETILSAETMLLQFKNINEEVFPQTTELALDLATRLGIDASSAAKMLGKALEEPGEGLMRLKTAGVAFTEEQEEMIASMVEAGNIAGAQKYILDELSTSIGGSARAAGETLAGQFDILKNTFSNVAESVGVALLPAITDMVSSITPIVETYGPLLAAWLGENIPKAIAVLGKWIEMLRAWWAEHGDAIMAKVKEIWDTIISAITAFINWAGPAISGFLAAIKGFWDDHGAQIIATVQAMWDGVKAGWETFKAAWEGLINLFHLAQQGKWYEFGEAIRGILDTAWENIKQAVKDAIDAIKQFFTDTDWGAVGEGILKGIGDGITAGLQWLKDAAIAAAKAALEAAKGFLGIKSPSKVFAEVGVNMMKGMAQGIAQSSGMPVMATIGAASQSVQAAGMVNNYWNLTINEAGSRGNVVMDFALLQALARG